MAPRWRAAWWPKKDKTRGGEASGFEHGSTLASSVVAEEGQDAGRRGVWF